MARNCSPDQAGRVAAVSPLIDRDGFRSRQPTTEVPAARWMKVIPVALVMYTIAFVHRTNISLALPQISHDLKLDAVQAGTAAGSFYWAYWVFQVPGGYLARRWSARKFIAVLLIAWGVFATSCGLARTGKELLLFRFLLGLSEGGAYPAALVLLAQWFPKRERARANALWNLCLPAAVVLSSPLSGWILDRWNWRVMMIAEGLIPFVWVMAWLAVIRDSPAEAEWISQRELEYLEMSLAEEAADARTEAHVSKESRPFLTRSIGVLAGTYFCFISGQIGLLFWLPSAMSRVGALNNTEKALLFTIPFIIGGCFLVLASHHSDKTRERSKHVSLTLAIGGACLVLASAVMARSPVLAFSLICLSGIGAYAPLGPFWAIPTEVLPPSVAGPAMGFINAIGSLGGYVAPLVVGVLNKNTGSFTGGFLFLGLLTCLGAALALMSPIPHTRIGEST